VPLIYRLDLTLAASRSTPEADTTLSYRRNHHEDVQDQPNQGLYASTGNPGGRSLRRADNDTQQ
jgi:hypothetical protein